MTELFPLYTDLNFTQYRLALSAFISRIR